MSPYVVSAFFESASHAATASFKLSSVMAVKPSATARSRDRMRRSVMISRAWLRKNGVNVLRTAHPGARSRAAIDRSPPRQPATSRERLSRAAPAAHSQGRDAGARAKEGRSNRIPAVADSEVINRRTKN